MLAQNAWREPTGYSDVTSFARDEFRVEEITGTDLVALTYELRYRVWSGETPLLPHIQKQGLIVDEHEIHARHWAAFEGDQIVAAARMCIHEVQEESPDAPAFSKIRLPTPVATLNRLVVLRSVRKLGLANQLDHCRILAAKSDGAKCVVGTFAPARIAAVEKLGFHLTGEQWTQSYCESPAMHGMVLLF